MSETTELYNQKKFVLLPEESIEIEGSGTHIKSIINYISGHAILTNRRLIFCNKNIESTMMLAGLVGVALSMARKQVKISFQIALTDVKSVTKSKHGFASKYVFETVDGKIYNLQFTKEKNWVEGLACLNIQCLT